MANLDARFGLRPVGHVNGGCSGRTMKCYLPATYGTAVFVGDPVVLTGTSNTAAVTAGLEKHQIGTLPEVNKATAGDGNKIAGAIVGFENQSLRVGTAPQGTASTARVALVNVDPGTIYQVQASGAIGAASVGLNAPLVYTHSGDTNSGLSGAELDHSAVATTATEQLKIVRISTIPGRSDPASANTVVEVIINNHQYANVVAGV